MLSHNILPTLGVEGFMYNSDCDAQKAQSCLKKKVLYISRVEKKLHASSKQSN